MRTALGGLAAMAAAIGVSRFVYTPILPPMSAALGMPKTTTGVIASANYLGYLIGAFLAAMPLLSRSRRAWLIVALSVSALTSAAMGLASSPETFVVLRFVAGVASAFGLIFSSALVLDEFAAAGRPDLSAVHFAGVGAGIAISAVVVSALMALGFGWRALWFASGAVGLIAVAVVAALVRTGVRPAPARVSDARPGGGLVRLVLAYGLCGFGYVITATFLVAIVRESPSIRSLEPVVWVIVGATAIPSVAVWTWAGRRFGYETAFALACLLQAAGVLSSVRWVTPPGVLVAAVLLGGTFMGLTALGLVRARQLVSGDPSRILAVMTAAFGLGQIVGPAFAGVVYDITGTFDTPSVTAAAALGVAGLLVRCRWHPRRGVSGGVFSRR